MSVSLEVFMFQTVVTERKPRESLVNFLSLPSSSFFGGKGTPDLMYHLLFGVYD